MKNNWLADMMRVNDGARLKGHSYLYQDWLKTQLAGNRPWNETVFQLLTADGRLVDHGATGWLLRDRGMPLDSLSNTLTTFLEANVACAQCHDHPFADWKQREFYSMAAFFGATDVSKHDPQNLAKKISKDDKQFLANLLAPNMAEVRSTPEKHLSFPDDYKY